MLYTASSLHHPTQSFHSHSPSFNFNDLRPIKNGAAIAASGTHGTVALKRFLDVGRFDVTIIGRAGSTSSFHRHVKAVDVDYSSMKSLKPADLG